MTADPDRAWLSPLLNRIAAVAGERAALILGAEKACERIYIPERLEPDHWLIALVGAEPAAAIAAEFGGQKLDIPPALAGQKRQRQRAIAKMTERGRSINAIAKTLGIARSTVKDHRKRLRDDDQGTLL